MELRLSPEQDFFPKPNEVAREIKRQIAAAKHVAQEAATKFRPCGETFEGGWRCCDGGLVRVLENPRRVSLGQLCKCWEEFKASVVDGKSKAANG